MKIFKALILVFFASLFFTNSSLALENTVEENMSVESTVDKFYQSFADRDYQSMNSLYAQGKEDIFSDPIFQNLSSDEVQAMWAMLLGGLGDDFKAEYEVESINKDGATIHWQATYTLPSTGRTIINNVTSELKIENGLIVNQKDDFDLCKWARQGFGFAKGQLICLFPNRTVRKQARENLEKFMEKQK